MARRQVDNQVDKTVQRAQFAVRELTNSRVCNAAEQRERAQELRAQRLRDIGWSTDTGSDADGGAEAVTDR